MTYNVFGGMLNLAVSIYHLSVHANTENYRLIRNCCNVVGICYGEP